MLSMTIKGVVPNYPETKTSAKGNPYVKLMVEVPQGEGKWPKRVYLTAFGTQANDIAQRVQSGMTVEVVADPSARAYSDKLGRPAAVLEGIVRSCKILSAPAPQPEAAVFQEATITEDDIPF
jgi:single-stranded DNA-binding protein